MSQELYQEQASSPLSCFSINKTINSNRNPIYQAYDKKLNRQVVLKTFPYRASIQKTYLREKTHLMNLNHPYIVQLYEAVDCTISNFETIEKKVSYIALEYASNGDVLDVIQKYGQFSETLARALFHQLIEAISYLHSRNVAHLDLKVDNMLIDELFNLKLIDFDLSQTLDSTILEAKGTPGCRAPEVKTGICSNLRAADIYSAAIILFIMITGYPPYLEVSQDSETEYDAYYRIMRKNNNRFWEVHAKHKKNPDFFSDDFKELINAMLSEEPRERPTIEDIKKSKWYTGPTVQGEKFKTEMKKYMRHIEQDNNDKMIDE